MDRFDAISYELDYIERQNDVRIIYACESGSRAWGFASPDSDFDVRFVFVRPISDYLRLSPPKDTIEWSIPAENNGVGADFDASGWDLRKFLLLLRKHNPSAVEWLGSPIVYREESRFWRLRDLDLECFDPVSSAWHYHGMAESTVKGRLKGEKVPAKGYLYVIRAILAARWSISRFEPVPVPFGKLRDAMMPAELAHEVERMLVIKLSGAENGLVGHSEALDGWISDELEALPDEIRRYQGRQAPDIGKFDAIFRMFVGL